jgi:hypothetical protein
VKAATPLYEGHVQPKIPFKENYYDLSIKENIVWQVCLAKKYGIYGLGIYHYWFSSRKCLLTKPAEILLSNEELDMPFFFAWDNISWKRSWSNMKGNDWSPIMDSSRNVEGNPLLIEYQLGDRTEWKKHFDYLLPYFKDRRYEKIGNKPVFVIYHYSERICAMSNYWDELAMNSGFDGIHIIYRYDVLDKIPKREKRFFYEPIHSAWGGVVPRITNKLNRFLKRPQKLQIYDYDSIWKKILKNAQRNSDENVYYGAFVNYDDTPRRGCQGKIIKESSPIKFADNLRKLVEICQMQNKDYIFLTAWNEWGEGAYLEPDEENDFSYLEAIRQVSTEIDSKDESSLV